MTVTGGERVTSRSGVIDRTGDKQRRYYVQDDAAAELSSADVEAWILANAPSTHEGYVYDGATYDTEDALVWDVIVYYRKPNAPSSDPPPAGEARFSFKVTGESQKITHPKADAYRQRYTAPGASTISYEGIGDNGEQINGADVLIPKVGFSFEYTIPADNMTLAYLVKIMDRVGTQNDDVFYNFAANTVLLESVSGVVEIGKDTTLTFDFAFSPNVDDMTIGTVTGIAKKGWDLIDPHVVRTTESGYLRTKVEQVDVIQVYDDADFSELGIPGT